MITLEDAMQQAHDSVAKQFTGNVNTHAPGRYISVSQLVRMSATAYAIRLMAERNGEPGDHVDPYFSFWGNSLADGALADWPCREVRVKLPLAHGWQLTGHADAVRTFGDFVFVAEHKAHNDATTEKAEIARRQATLYLSMMENMAFSRNPPSHVFEAASYAQKKTERFMWGSAHKAAGICIAVSTPTPPGTAIVEAVNAEARAKCLDFYIRKATAIVEAVVTNSLDPVTQFDLTEGHTEFTRPLATVTDPPGDLKTLLTDFMATKLELKDIEAVHNGLKKDIERAMIEGALDKIQVGSVRAKMIHKTNRSADVKALERDGLRQYIRTSTSSYADVREVKGNDDDDSE